MPVEKEENQREIEILEERLAKLKEALQAGQGPESPPVKELLREAVRERIREAMPLPPSPIPAVPPLPVTPSAIPKTMHDEYKEVEQYVEIAFSKGIPQAIKAVLKTGNAHLIDAFHEVLVDRFYEELVKSGKIK
jgi:hypothetical protein